MVSSLQKLEKCLTDCSRRKLSDKDDNPFQKCTNTCIHQQQIESEKKYAFKQLSSQCEDDDKDCKVRSMCKNADVKCEPLNDVTISQMKNNWKNNPSQIL